jgi:hypothetical protein
MSRQSRKKNLETGMDVSKTLLHQKLSKWDCMLFHENGQQAMKGGMRRSKGRRAKLPATEGRERRFHEARLGRNAGTGAAGAK